MRFLQHLLAYFAQHQAQQRGVGCVMGSGNFQTIFHLSPDPATADLRAQLAARDEQLRLALALIASQAEVITLLRQRPA